MPSPQDSRNWGLGGLLIVVVALIVAAALPGRTVTSTDDPLPADWDQQLSAETARVAGKHATGGFKFAGIRLAEKTYRLDLHFLGSPECTFGDCAGPDGLVGEVVGNTIDGNRMVSSRVEVSRDCYQLIEITDAWPSFSECVAVDSNGRRDP